MQVHMRDFWKRLRQRLCRHDIGSYFHQHPDGVCFHFVCDKCGRTFGSIPFHTVDIVAAKAHCDNEKRSLH